MCTTERVAHDRVLRVLLGAGANPNSATKPDVETGGFMRDCRTKGETPLHRAAAFGTEETLQFLLDAGATIDAKDAYGDSPLSWASWYGRPDQAINLWHTYGAANQAAHRNYTFAWYCSANYHKSCF